MLRPAVLIVLLLATGTHGCTTNPVSGKKQPSLMSEEREIATGRKFDPKIRKQYGVYDDPELQAYVTRIGKKLAAQSHRPNLVYRFTVLDSPEVNAFALPGGYIYITRGLMVYLNSEAELAAVLGHEIGHVTAKHAVRQYTTATAANIGYTVGALFIPELANQNAANLFNILGSALISGYGRKHELEADGLGAEYLARAGYDPQAILGVLAVLKNQEEFEKERAKIEGREARVYHGVFGRHVLGHEIGHVTAKHAVQQYTTATAASVGYTIGAIFIPELANQNAANLFNILGSALISGYGRKHELEADGLGAEYLARAGYDPQAILGVLAVLKNQEEFEKERAKIEGREARVYHGVFASHPSADKRLQEVVAESKQSQATTARVGQDEFLAQLDGVVFGDSARQGIRYDQKFFHKKLGFALEFPPDWRIQNRPKQVEATSHDNNAVMILTVEDLNLHISPRELSRLMASI